jgi:hypothetical protein
MAAGSRAGFRLAVAVHGDIPRGPFLSPVMGVPFAMRIMISAMPLLHHGTTQKCGGEFGLLLIRANEVNGNMYRVNDESLLRDVNETLEGFNIRLMQSYKAAAKRFSWSFAAF